MLNNKTELLTSLRRAGLHGDEAKVYLTLLEQPMTHLELSRKTGVNRSKVYRIADDLQRRSLVSVVTRDEGKILSAGDPSNLEVSIINDENKLKSRRDSLTTTLPDLQHLFKLGGQAQPNDFYVTTYSGVDGLKQMLWNELRTTGEICIYAHETLDQLGGTVWAEKYRSKLADLEIPHRVIENIEADHVLDKTEVEHYKNIYNVRYVDRATLDIKQELTIHNDVVSIYHWNADKNGPRVGLEIHSKQFADMQKAMFEQYWDTASKV